jgi:hypothetical protein
MRQPLVWVYLDDRDALQPGQALSSKPAVTWGVTLTEYRKSFRRPQALRRTPQCFQRGRSALDQYGKVSSCMQIMQCRRC